MNLIEGVAEPGGVRTSDGILLPVSGAEALPSGRRVHYGIRPEHFVRADDGIAFTIVTLEPTGSETMVVVRLGRYARDMRPQGEAQDAAR